MILINTKMPKGCWNCGFCCDNGGYYCSVNHNRLAYSIADIPSERPTDCPLVEVVTCEHCKFNDNSTCTMDGFGVADDYFCAGGKRRESK